MPQTTVERPQTPAPQQTPPRKKTALVIIAALVGLAAVITAAILLLSPKEEKTGDPMQSPSPTPDTYMAVVETSPSPLQTIEPSAEPTTVPSTEPSAEPTTVPSTEPTTDPTEPPETSPSVETLPAVEVTPEPPTAAPTVAPTPKPSPTATPKPSPTATPTPAPTVAPTPDPYPKNDGTFRGLDIPSDVTIESLRGNAVVDAILDNSFSDVGINGAMGYVEDANGVSCKFHISIDENGYYVDIMQGLSSDLEDGSYKTFETALTAKVTKEDAAKIIAQVKKFREAMNNNNKKYAEYYEGGDYLHGWWLGPDNVKAEKTKNRLAIEKEYKVTDSVLNETRIWWIVGSVNVAFEWSSSGFAVIVK